jgi:coenzyme F420-reducing hydrogenase beta subunit
MQTFYKFKHSDLRVEKCSSSGGAFTMLTDKVLNAGGIIYGCAFDDKLDAVHIRADSSEDRDKMRGSKYIQSNLSTVFELIASDLHDGRIVLFSGTPCQVSAVTNYLKLKKIPINTFVSVEVICHGVGSNKFFYDYVRHKEKKFRSKAVMINFRSKYRPGQKQDMTIRFENGKAYHAASTNLDWFYSIYLKNLILRPACYKCKFARQERIADLSIADFWGSEGNDVFSLIACHTNKGAVLLDNPVDGQLSKVDRSAVHQPHMKAPCDMPEQRAVFWNTYLQEGYEAVQAKFGNNTLKGRIKYRAADVVQALHIGRVAKRVINKIRKNCSM